MPNGLEIRSTAAELRAVSGRTLAGLAAVFDRPTPINGFTEVVRRGAFAAHLASGADVFLLAHHSWDQPLARTGNGSLSLAEDHTGLRFEATLPETRAADDILALARSGTIAGCSVGFRVPKGGDVWPSSTMRELRQLELVEVSAVAQPAYKETTITARSRQHVSPELRRLRLLVATL